MEKLGWAYKAMSYHRLVALAGSVLTLVQIILLAGDQQGICFNDGCAIVDSLTTVPPIVFNIGGFFFFQAVFWGLWMARKEERYITYVNLLLLAGLAAEAVLFYFQHAIIVTSCAYCLIILALVVVLNALGGIFQIVSGATIFIAVTVAMSTLQFSSGSGVAIDQLDRGSMAFLKDKDDGAKRYLFFSSDCKYCEKVIDFIAENPCSVRFNPIEKIEQFSLDGAIMGEKYIEDVNRRFLAGLSIEQIPVLVSVYQDRFSIINGEQSIVAHLKKSCAVEDQVSSQSTGFTPSGTLNFLPPALDDSCSVNSDCEDTGTSSKAY